MFDALTVADERLVFILVGVIKLCQSFLQISPLDDAGRVVGGVACPIAVEVLGNFGYDAACGEDIEVGKDGIVVNLKIFVADIASAQMVARLSAVNDLLCIRRLSRGKSAT